MQEIGVETKLVAILGDDVGHSKSPSMLNAAFREKKLNYYYFPIDVKPKYLADVVRGISKMNFAGFTLTMPHKIEIMKYLDEIDPLAEKIGSVNTVKIIEGKLIGYNTDGEGFVKSLEIEKNIKCDENIFFVIGAGGASRAITTTLASRNAKKIYIANRTLEKATNLSNIIKEKIGYKNCIPLNLGTDNLIKYVKNSNVIINTTNIGMHPYEDKSPIDTSFLRKELTVADVIYSPDRTVLLQAALEKGCDVINGKGMLLYQGYIAFEIWTGLKAPKVAMKEALID